MKLLFDPLAGKPLWFLRLLWLAPLLPLIFETDLTALLWLGSTALILMTSASARAAVFQMIYKSWPVTLALGLVLGSVVGLLLNPLMDSFAEQVTGTAIDLSQFADVQGDAGAYMELLIVALLFGGVIEEVTFRGFFIGWGMTLFGKHAAIPLVIVSSLAFAIGHFYQGMAGGISTGIFSLMMGCLYLAFDRKLLPLILIHAVSNFWGVTEIYRFGV
ncbi:CPBP family intramembrane glutamic endopeptidase [Altererythrobacter lutimaris]|uniref:CPBP family intramembrane metalloprotease n=1 Tax=Altererythrobacter lutimaris TaxID=2743979 RepID=A0A850HBV0_9SPHN|nr:CPBP family intramembrane glutamic endopeptidase [Altererythrobacter lutimaris]NVE94396.1 CPBP family intramembrane metalloprotease [Altererythrobacter lutimaris]